VTGAAGATGSLVCQLAKIRGAKVVAIAGSEDKCNWLTHDLGVDMALNYKSKTFYDDFKKKVGYVDLMFDNVGGNLLNFVLTRLNKGARIVLCGKHFFAGDYTAYLRLIFQVPFPTTVGVLPLHIRNGINWSCRQ
jgi:NADPH-dependent curcumin reductase CurA